MSRFHDTDFLKANNAKFIRFPLQQQFISHHTNLTQSLKSNTITIIKLFLWHKSISIPFILLKSRFMLSYVWDL